MLTPTNPSLFFSRQDAQDPRLGEFVKDSSKGSVPTAFKVMGYPDDEGIRLSGGRPGAQQGPDQIRKYFYKMTPPLFGPKTFEIIDLGNLEPTGELGQRHNQAQKLVQQELEGPAPLVTLGGGHDWAYADGAGFLKKYPQGLIINFDAHLDVRPLDRGLTSGTPFFRILTECPKTKVFQIGIQNQCNSQTHWQWFHEQGGQALTLNQLLTSPKDPVSTVVSFMEPFLMRRAPAFISIDMDVFSSAFAPGCSQVFPAGMGVETFQKILVFLLNRLDVHVLGIYETSPPLDRDNQTSILAAQILHWFLESRTQK